MNLFNILRFPFWVLAILGKSKSFFRNPVIGNKTLNKYGLHIWRVRLASIMTAYRRKKLSRNLSSQQIEQFEENGFFLVHNFLSKEHFDQLKKEVTENLFQSWEMRQGQTVTRMIPMEDNMLENLPALKSFYDDPRLKSMFCYAASWKGSIVKSLETIIADPKTGSIDPQTELHSDTFHSSAKFWFYLHDVEDAGGPFQYVPGSQKITPQRLDWEYKNSIEARALNKPHHSGGSFRVSINELENLGYTQPKRMTVPENTLLIGDTYGFHARSISTKPTVRVSVHGHMRRNPFIPWTGGDLNSLPGLKGHQLGLYFRYLDFLEKHFNMRPVFRNVGKSRADDSAHI